jgi:HEAT repeat protein
MGTNVQVVKQLNMSKIRSSLSLNMLLFFFLGMAATVGRWASIALFSTEVGAKSLSDIYAIDSVVYFFIALYIIDALSRHAVLNFIRWVLFVCFVITSLDGILLMSSMSTYLVSFIVIISVTGIISAVEMIMWVCAAQFFSSQHAKRVYAYLMGANAIGGLIGSIELSLFSEHATTVSFISIMAMCLLICSFIVLLLEKNYWHINFEDDSAQIKFKEVVKHLSQSPNWLKLMGVAIMLLCLFYVSDFQLIVAAQHTYSNINALTNFFGLFEIVCSLCTIAFAFFIGLIIPKIGVWTTCALALFFVAVSFFVIAIAGEKILLVSFSRILAQLFWGLGSIAIGIICKNAKKEYQVSIISLFDFLPVCIGTMLASLFAYLLKFNVLSFEYFSLLMGSIAFCIFIWVSFSKKVYIEILQEGIEGEKSKIYSNYERGNEIEKRSSDMLYETVGKWDFRLKKLRNLSLEFSMELKDKESLKLFLNILEGLNEDDPEVRVKALVSLIKFKELPGIIPFITASFEDDNPFVIGQALLTLYEFDSSLAYDRADSILQTLLSTRTWPYEVLAYEIIAKLKLKKYIGILNEAIDEPEDKVRQAIYSAYAELCEVDDEKTLILLRDHLGEQNSKAASVLVNTIIKLVDQKKHLFENLIFSNEPYLWKNAVELVVKLNLKNEKEFLIFSAVNKLHCVYENLQSIEVLLNHLEHRYTNVLAQHLYSQNCVILKVIIYIITNNSDYEDIVDVIFKEIRSPKPDVKATALELIENLGDPRITNHLVTYFSQELDSERILYAKKTWHLEDCKIEDTLKAMLLEDNEWIKACTIYVIGFLGNADFIPLLQDIVQNSKIVLLVENAKKAINKICNEDDMPQHKHEIEMMDMVVFLKGTSMFSDVHLTKIAIIAKFMEQHFYRPNDVVIQKGKPVNGIYIIYEGIVKIQELNMELTNPSVIGAQWMIEEVPSKEEILAKTDVYILSIPKRVYKNVITLHPEVAIGLLSELCSSLRRYQERIDNVNAQ